ncbi:MAG: type III-A CRISPR-associated RAMP protein Csm5 [Candidatus Magnetobacterium sp. LHC-1]
MEKPIRARLHVMSPVHIGCDDVYEPTSFFILKEGDELNLAAFDPMVFVDSLSKQDREEFLGICDKGSVASIVEMMNFIADKFQPSEQGIIRVSCSSALLDHCKKVKGIRGKNPEKELNQFQIARTAYNPHNNLPYIPGSSIKGAIRTAYLNKLAKESNRLNTGDKKDANKYLESQLLGGQFETDPLRLLKVSDFVPAGEAKCKIFYAVNRKKDQGQTAKGPYQILETIRVGTVFSGAINIDQPSLLQNS